MKIFRKILILAAALTVALMLSACEKAALQINDNGVVTEIEVTIPKTVEKILNAAEIELGENDVVSPSLDTKLEEVEEIVISREHAFTLTVGDETKDITMVGGTVQDLLDQEGIVLGENQHVNYEMEDYLSDGMDVKVFYQFEVKVICDGKTISETVDAETVEEALAKLEITLNEDDRVTPELTKALADGMNITVVRITKEEVEETEEIAYETSYVNDSSMSKGTSKTTTAGVNGEKKITYEVIYADGEEESREVISEEVTKEAVNAVVHVGTYVAPAASSSSSSISSSSSGGSSGKTETSRTAVYDCDGSGHGYYEVHYSDGSVAYIDF